MRNIACTAALIVLCASRATAEVIQTEPSCAYAVDHAPDSGVVAEDLNGPIDLPPLELELRRYIPVGGAWFIEAALGTIRVDLQTGAVAGRGGRAVSAKSTETTCE